MPTPILLAVVIASFFVPQITAVGAVALIKNEVAAVILGVFVFIVLVSAHAALAYYSYTLEPGWWSGKNWYIPLLYIPALIFSVICVAGAGQLLVDKRYKRRQ